MAGPRDVTVQTFSWFRDLHRRDRLDLEPPYQRRSVWTQPFKDFFIDTVLNGFPCPAIFLYRDVDAETGKTTYAVVDGKQRLTTLLEFVEDAFPVSEDCTISKLRGKNFSSFDGDVKKQVWAYQFMVEYVPSENEELINNIFDRINRNVARLTPQELRHAKLSGKFIGECERLAELLQTTLPRFPSIQTSSIRQMKDVEFTATLLLFVEQGEKSLPQQALDEAFAARDDEWELEHETVAAFERTVSFIAKLVKGTHGKELLKSRLRNQADFYSLFAAVYELHRSGRLPERQAKSIAAALINFLEKVQSESEREKDRQAKAYYDAARSASNDPGPRRIRIDALKSIIGRK